VAAVRLLEEASNITQSIPERPNARAIASPACPAPTTKWPFAGDLGLCPRNAINGACSVHASPGRVIEVNPPTPQSNGIISPALANSSTYGCQPRRCLTK
jgi:hypothetical protein